PEARSDLRGDADMAEQCGNRVRVDEHVVVCLVVAAPETVGTHEGGHLTPKYVSLGYRRACHEHPVLAGPHLRGLIAAGLAPSEIAEIEGEHPVGPQRTAERGQRPAELVFVVEIAQGVPDTDDGIGDGYRIVRKSKLFERRAGDVLPGQLD